MRFNQTTPAFGRLSFTFLVILAVLVVSAASPRPAEAVGAGQYAPPEWFPLRRDVSGGEIRIGCTYRSSGGPYFECDGYHPVWALDLGAGIGSPVFAAGAGFATSYSRAKKCDGNGYGNAVVVDHGPYGKTIYGHLSEIQVPASGAWVDHNTQIGLVGNTGNSSCTFPHLHFERFTKKPWVTAVDPGELKACHSSGLVTYPAVLGLSTWESLPWGVYSAHSDCSAAGRRVLAGDWNGDGTDSPGFYSSATSTFTFLDSTGRVRERPDQQFGSAGDFPVVGDWDGDGKSTAGVFDPRKGTFRLTNDGTSPQPKAEVAFNFGEIGDIPVAADWDGDGTTDVGTFRGGTWNLDFGRDGGVPDRIVSYGLAGDMPVPGNWDAVARDDLIVFRAADPDRGTSRFHFDSGHSGGVAERCSKVGDVGDWPLVGDWDGDGDDNVGLYRATVDQFFLIGGQPLLVPVVTVNPTEGPQGTAFEARGSGYACDRTATSHLRRVPDGTEFPTLALTTDSSGGYMKQIDSTGFSSGLYQHWVVDDASGIMSNVATFEVVAATGRNEVSFPDAEDQGWNPSLALDVSGNPVVAYYGATNGDLKVLHCGNPSCTAGNSIVSADTEGDVGWYPSITLDSSGNPVVSYYEGTSDIGVREGLKVLHCGNPACTTGNTIATPDTTILAGYGTTSIKLADDGSPVVAYIEGRTTTLRILRCGNATCTTGNTIVTPDDTPLTGALVGHTHPSLALDRSGNAVVTYEETTVDPRTGHLRVLHCGNATCTAGNTIAVVDQLGSFGNTSLALDSGGNPVIGYAGADRLDLRVAHCRDANCAVGTVLVTPDTGSLAFPSLVLDAAGNPVVSYHDATNHVLKLLHCGNPDCTSGNTIAMPASASVSLSQDTLGPSMELDASGGPIVAFHGLSVLHCATPTCLEEVTQTIVSTDVPRTIPDPGQVTSILNFTGAGSIVEMTLVFQFTHACERDLRMVLRHPDGASVIVMDRGNQACTGTATTFVSNNPGVGPFFANRQAAVTWSLEVTDDSPGFTGTIDSWSLTIRLRR